MINDPQDFRDSDHGYYQGNICQEEAAEQERLEQISDEIGEKQYDSDREEDFGFYQDINAQSRGRKDQTMITDTQAAAASVALEARYHCLEKIKKLKVMKELIYQPCGDFNSLTLNGVFTNSLTLNGVFTNAGGGITGRKYIEIPDVEYFRMMCRNLVDELIKHREAELAAIELPPGQEKG